MQFLLPKTPEKAYFLKQEERNWLANRQRREQEIRAGHNSKTGGTLRELPLLMPLGAWCCTVSLRTRQLINPLAGGATFLISYNLCSIACKP